ncbi:MAG: hypothetical protein FJ098_04545 [Deltaproteobacteria bacterium]|nr:hypothetical protein [Deltaproteobacteria bacterium]
MSDKIPFSGTLFCDVDGVICNLVEAVLARFAHALSLYVPVEAITQWNVPAAIGEYLLKRGEGHSRLLLERFVATLFDDHRFMAACLPHLDMLVALQGWKRVSPGVLQLVTARPGGLKDTTRTWLNNYGFGDCQITHEARKLDYFRQVQGSRVPLFSRPWLVLEDNVETVLDLNRAFREWGIDDRARALLVARPWNRADAAAHGLLRYTAREIADELGLDSSVLLPEED